MRGLGGAGGGKVTCPHGVRVRAGSGGLPEAFWDCAICIRDRAEVDHAAFLAMDAAGNKTRSAEESLAASPPTEAELAKYLAAKQREAAYFMAPDDPEFPRIISWELKGAAAEEFLRICRKGE